MRTQNACPAGPIWRFLLAVVALAAGIHALDITVDLSGVGETVGTYHSFNVEMKPPHGAVFKITRVTPGYLDSVMILR